MEKDKNYKNNDFYEYSNNELKMNKLNELKPIEKLYLISMESKEVFSKKNRMYCLLYELFSNNNINLKGRKNLNITLNGKEINNVYETEILNYLVSRKYIELDKFIENLKIFNQTLVNKGILTQEIKAKKVFFINIAKTEINKTSLYYELQADIKKQLESNLPIINLVCGNKNADNVSLIYNILKSRMINAKMQEEKKKKESSANTGSSIGFKENKK